MVSIFIAGEKERITVQNPKNKDLNQVAVGRERNSTLDLNFNHVWTVRLINDGTMKRISVFDFYVLGKSLEQLFQVSRDTPWNDAGWGAMAAYRQLREVVREDSVFLPASRRAAKTLMSCLIRYFGDGIEAGLPTFYEFDEVRKLGPPAADEIKRLVVDFDTIFKNDMPSMTVFSAEQKGIYQTEGLIDNASKHFPESISKRLPGQAKTDIDAGGRCLAFNVPTACAFHMWRALEVVFGAYYVSIAGKTFEENKIARNWGKYVEALEKVGADQKIVGNLEHIRKEYRNPVMRPNENVTADEAFSLFGIGVSSITQVMQAIETQPYAAKALS